MKKILSLLLAMTMTIGVFSGLSVNAEEAENGAEETTVTYGLDNLNNEAGELKVAFIGGSITQGAGDVSNKKAERYSGKLVNDYFKTKFPNKTVTEINAGIGGTPSEYGMFRLGKDVLQFAPDVVFVEFAVNDLNHAATTAGQLKVRSQMESIVRQLEALPKIPVIIFLYSHCENKQDYLENAIKEHQKIASYYGIGSINLHEYVLAEEEAGTVDWYNEEKVNCMSGDGTHPNTAGYAMYADYIAECFEESYTSYFKKPKIRNAQYEQGYIYANPHTVKFDDESIDYTGTWTESPNLDYLQDGTHDWVINPENLNSTFIQAQAGGETVTYTFTGRSIGIAYGHVFNGGKFTYVVDEGTDNEITGEIECYTDAIRYYQTYKLISNDLAYGEHTIKVTNVPVDETRTNFAFSHFLVDDEEPVIGVDELPDFSVDYVPGEMPSSMITMSNFKQFGRTCGSVTREQSENVNALNAAKDIAYRPQNGFRGMVGKSTTFEAGKNYVFYSRVKKTAGDDVYVGMAISNETEATISYSKEYGRTGMKVTEEYQDFKDVIKVVDNYNNSATTHALTIGFPEGVKTGARIEFDTAQTAVYLAEEIVYDIKTTKISGPEKLNTTSEMTFKAEVINQIGLPGYLEQEVDWYAMDTARSQFIDGITISENTNGTVTVTVDDTVKSGEYVVVAVSDTYGMAKGANIKVVAKDYYYDFKSPEKKTNLFDLYGTGTSENYFSTGVAFSRNNGSIEGSFAKDEEGNNVGYIFEAKEELGYNVYHALPGWILTKERTWAEFTGFKKNTTYVFKARLKDVSNIEGEPAVMGIAMHNETGKAEGIAYADAYGANGLVLTSEYQDFVTTITPTALYDEDSENHFLTLGFIPGAVAGTKAQIDITGEDCVYLAEEQVYDITNTISGSTTIARGGSAEFEAAVINQLEYEGTLKQNFTWVAMDTARQSIIDGIEITTADDTGIATVVIGENVPAGEYSIVAVSTDYDIAKGVQITVPEETEVITSFNLIQDAGYAQLIATVEKIKAEKVRFFLAQYDGTTNELLGVVSDDVTVSDGVAECDIFFEDALSNGTLVKAFIWDGMRPIDGIENFNNQMIINTAE